jgi:predicted NAD/FAD-binding protein
LEKGSQSYKKLLVESFKDRIKINNAVIRVKKENGKCKLLTVKGDTDEFDKVIFACHADQALRILHQPTSLESQLLSLFKYQQNVATVHSDESLMPKNKKVWSSWNYRIEEKEGRQIPTTKNNEQ